MRISQEAMKNPKENPAKQKRKYQRTHHLADEDLPDVVGGQRENGKQREQDGVEGIFFEHAQRYFTR